MRFLCIIDMVIWASGGIIKHSSIYKGRLAGALRVSERDRHLEKVRYSQVQQEITNIPALLGSTHPLGLLPLWKWVTRIHNGLISEKCPCIHLCKGIKIPIYVCFPSYSVAWPLWPSKACIYLNIHSVPYVFTYYLVSVCGQFCLTKWNSRLWQRGEKKKAQKHWTFPLERAVVTCGERACEPEQPMHVYLVAPANPVRLGKFQSVCVVKALKKNYNA